MIPALHCTVLRRYPVALIVVAGVLRLDSATVLRAAALKVLADRPAALVLDLADTEVLESAAATVLPLVEQHAAAWADTALLLGAPSPSVRSELRRLGSDLPAYDTRAGALTAAAAHPVPSRVRLQFAPDGAAPAAARRAVRAACAKWDLHEGLGERAAQVANELVTNVIEHAGTPGVLLLSHGPSFLHIAVRDGSREPPVAAPAVDGNGFGLTLVRALSSGFGTRRVPDGKVVWSTLRIWPYVDGSVAVRRRTP